MSADHDQPSDSEPDPYHPTAEPEAYYPAGEPEPYPPAAEPEAYYPEAEAEPVYPSAETHQPYPMAEPDPYHPTTDLHSPYPAAEPAGENGEAFRQKRRYKKEAEQDEPAKPEQAIQLLSSLLHDLLSRREKPAEVENETKTAKYHRLSKTGSGVPAPLVESAAHLIPQPAPVTPDDRVLQQTLAPIPATALLAGSFSPPTPFETAAAVRGRKRLRTLAVLGVLALLGASFYAGTQYGVVRERVETSAKAATPPPAAWTDEMIGRLDQALDADQAGNIPEAQRLASALRKPGTPSPPGLDFYLASLIVRQDRVYDAEQNLYHLGKPASPETAARVNEALAFGYTRNREFEKANDVHLLASQSDPFSAALFYRWGDSLRHAGHFQDASLCFRRALARLPTGQPESESLRDCINLKQRLSLVEQGQEDGLQAELDEKLKAPSPSGYWLLTAAAGSLQHEDYAAAAGFLGRAREALGKTQFDSLLNDYYFRGYVGHKELAEFLPPVSAARQAEQMATMSYTVGP